MAPRSTAKNTGQELEVGPGTVGDDTTPDAEAPEASAPPAPPAEADAAAPESEPASDDEHAGQTHLDADPDGDHKIVTRVWAAEGRVPKASILQTAIQSVRDAIPVVFELDAEITGAQKKEVDGQPGTEFEVTITYTPRAVQGKADEVDVDKVIAGLDVPRSFDGIGGHDGDPEFHERKPAEL